MVRLAAGGSGVKAVEQLEDMRRRGLTPTVKSFNTVIHACARVGDHLEAERWLSEMRLALQTSLKAGLRQREQLKPTQFSYSNAAWSFLSA